MRSSILLLGLLTLSVELAADPVRGKDRLLCAPAQTTVCTLDGECHRAAPGEMQIPEFLLVDLGRQELMTTAASGQNRSSALQSLTRTEGQIVLHSFQGGRALSMVIDEASGGVSAAIVFDGVTIGVFGACTPVPVR